MTELGKIRVMWHRFKNNEDQIVTVSQVFDEKNQFIGVGKTILGKKDIHNPNKGRVVSLRRALAETSLSKEERTKVWEDYRVMPAKPRW